jgi:hypothetical protein
MVALLQYRLRLEALSTFNFTVKEAAGKAAGGRGARFEDDDGVAKDGARKAGYTYS